MIQVQQFGTGSSYDLEILHQCGKIVKIKSQKAFWANSYVCRIYRKKSGKESFCHPFECG